MKVAEHDMVWCRYDYKKKLVLPSDANSETFEWRRYTIISPAWVDYQKEQYLLEVTIDHGNGQIFNDVIMTDRNDFLTENEYNIILRKEKLIKIYASETSDISQ